MIIKTVTQCNQLFSAPTPHPLVGIIRLSESANIPEMLQFGFHSIWLEKWAERAPSCFGRKKCDFCENTLLALPSGMPVRRDLWANKTGKRNVVLFCFHSSVFNPLKTGKDGRYSFFKYRTEESLHLSWREQSIVEREISEIEEELYWGIDEYSPMILAERIKLLMDYVARFYKRQFILRHDDNQQVIRRTDDWLNDFFVSGRARYMPLPTSQDFAGLLGCSPDYFNDLLKYETGKDTEDYVNFKRISRAEDMLKRGAKSIEEIAEDLGFPTDLQFCGLIGKLKGKSPEKIVNLLS